MMMAEKQTKIVFMQKAIIQVKEGGNMKKIIQKIKVYIVEENIGGVSHEPIVFVDAKKANKHYIKLVNEVYSTNFKGIKETLEYMKENNGANDHEILYWTTEVK